MTPSWIAASSGHENLSKTENSPRETGSNRPPAGFWRGLEPAPHGPNGHHTARQARRLIAGSDAVEVLHVATDVEDDAWRWLDRRDEREHSFVDATSFALMQRRGLTEALAFDGDFSAAGFVEVRP